MQIVNRETRQQRISVQHIPKEIVDKVTPMVGDMFDYELAIDIGQGMCLPGATKYRVGMRVTNVVVASQEATNDVSKAKGGYNFWSERITKKFQLPYKHLSQVGKVFLYLLNSDGDTISYKKFRATDFNEAYPDWQFAQLLVDPSVGEITDKRNGGIIQFRCYLRKVGPGMKPANIEEALSRSPPPKRPLDQKVRAYIFQCKDLPAGDDDGLSDPYVQIWDQRRECAPTSHVPNSLNPIFYQVREFSVSLLVDKTDQRNPEAILHNFPPV